MEKIAELLKNKKFLYIFSGFVALIGLILIFKNKSDKPAENAENDDLKEIIKETAKTVKLIKKKNDELERKSHGKSISKSDSPGKPKSTDKPGDNEEGKGKTTGKQDDFTDDEDNSDDLPAQ